MSHELIGLDRSELAEHYYNGDSDLQEALDSILL
jgi:hypothetical protein